MLSRLVSEMVRYKYRKKIQFNLTILNWLPDILLQQMIRKCYGAELSKLFDRWNTILLRQIRYKIINQNSAVMMRIVTGSADRSQHILSVYLQHRLIESIKANDRHTINTLKIVGADLSFIDDRHHNPLEIAAYYADAATLATLIHPTTEKHLHSALLIAARKGDNDKVKVLLKHGVNVALETAQRDTAFLLATRYQHVTTAAILAHEHFRRYRTKRMGESMFTGSIFGCSRTSKVNAAAAIMQVLNLPIANHHSLIDHLNAHHHLLSPHHRALHQGELGKLMLKLLNDSVDNLPENKFKLAF